MFAVVPDLAFTCGEALAQEGKGVAVQGEPEMAIVRRHLHLGGAGGRSAAGEASSAASTSSAHPGEQR